jgi:hypothetical protein
MDMDDRFWGATENIYEVLAEHGALRTGSLIELADERLAEGGGEESGGRAWLQTADEHRIVVPVFGGGLDDDQTRWAPPVSVVLEVLRQRNPSGR